MAVGSELPNAALGDSPDNKKSPPYGYGIEMEDGSFLLTEDGSYLVLESFVIEEGGGKNTTEPDDSEMWEMGVVVNTINSESFYSASPKKKFIIQEDTPEVIVTPNFINIIEGSSLKVRIENIKWTQ